MSLLAFTTPAFAEDDNAPAAPNSGQSGIQNPEGRQNGESGEFNHRVDERHEGSGEIIQFISVGGALIVAALLGTSLLGLVGGVLAVPIAAALILILDEVVFPKTDNS